jgi:hypothetical protein
MDGEVRDSGGHFASLRTGLVPCRAPIAMEKGVENPHSKWAALQAGSVESLTAQLRVITLLTPLSFGQT